jgi:hypothetical protein
MRKVGTEREERKTEKGLQKKRDTDRLTEEKKDIFTT